MAAALQSDAFWTEIAITQVSSGATSFFASSVIVGFILHRGNGRLWITNANANANANVADQNENGNNNDNDNGNRNRNSTNAISPYQRLVFGLSIFDIIKSIGTIIGPYTISADESAIARWAVGNKYTCQLDAYLFCVGSNGVHMYTLALCIYYVCRLNCKMTDEAFSHRLEKKMHVIITVLNVGMYMIAPFVNALNASPTGLLCYPSSPPGDSSSSSSSSSSSLSQKSFMFFFLWNSILVPISCFVGICVCMTMLICHAMRQEQIFGMGWQSQSQRQLRSSAASSSSLSSSYAGNFASRLRARWRRLRRGRRRANHANNADADADVTNVNANTNTNTSTNANNEHDDLMPPEVQQVDPESLSRLYKRELVIQAFSFLVAFCLTSLPFTTLHILFVTGTFSSFSFRAWMRMNVLFFPLAGFFHILIYMRPKVAHVKRTRRDFSSWYAFWLVLKSGGEVPDHLSNDDDNDGARQLDDTTGRSLRRPWPRPRPQLQPQPQARPLALNISSSMSEAQFGIESPKKKSSSPLYEFITPFGKQDDDDGDSSSAYELVGMSCGSAEGGSSSTTSSNDKQRN